jgi:parvulin-like peptidyl-prolyl isomerase
VRLRALVICHAGVEGAPVARTREEAFVMAESLAKRVAAGESLEALAREHDEDPGGRDRAGDLGWVYRGDPRRPEWTELVIARPVGWVTPAPITTPRGYALVAREE